MKRGQRRELSSESRQPNTFSLEPMNEVRRGQRRVGSRRGHPHAAAHIRRIFNAKHLFDWMMIYGHKLRIILEAGIVPCSCPVHRK